MGVDLGVYTMIRKKLRQFFRLTPSRLDLHRLSLFLTWSYSFDVYIDPPPCLEDTMTCLGYDLKNIIALSWVCTYLYFLPRIAYRRNCGSTSISEFPSAALDLC